MVDYTKLSIDEAEQVEETHERQCDAGRLDRIVGYLFGLAIFAFLASFFWAMSIRPTVTLE